MKSMICSVRDLKAMAFMAPFIAPTKGFAIRLFSDEVNRADSLLGKHPSDFVLHLIGYFEEETGTVTSCSHEILIEADRIVQMRQEA